MIHFCIGSATLCGAEYTEPSKKAAKDGRLCNNCIDVMWREQYRRNTLLPYSKNIDKSDIKRQNETKESIQEDTTPLYLKDYLTT
jgi:hypothetical protein|tara:strand:- start:296 stop:550 length:255 start_codon:yes stop_codon:yes gene_type:complete